MNGVCTSQAGLEGRVFDVEHLSELGEGRLVGL
jgi:hypothetical protein